MSKYADYDYLDIYNINVLGEISTEQKIEELRISRKRYKYIVKTIISGDMLECEVYPVYEKRKEIPRRERDNVSKLAQQNLNDKNSKKYFIRLVNTNFGKDDLIITLTYKDKYLPTQDRAKKDVENYIRRLKRYRKNNNLPELKFVYVIEWVDELEQHKSKKVRVHHHIIINGMDRDVAENLWGKGRVEAKRLQPDEFGLEGLARYMLKQSSKSEDTSNQVTLGDITEFINKQPKGSKGWHGSRNLTTPIIFRSISKLSKRKAEKIATSPNEWKVLFESLYQEKYQYNDCKTFISDFTGGFYLYCRMRRRH